MKAPLSLGLLFFLSGPARLGAAGLKPESVQAWDAYVREAEVHMEERSRGLRPFLWIDENREIAQRVRAGEIVVMPGNGENPHTVPDGLIHDWIGAVFIRNVSLDEAMDVLNDYSRYKDFYRPMVVESKLLERTPEHEKVMLMMMQRALAITAAVETDDDVKIAHVDSHRAYSFSTSTHVREIADYGKSSQHAFPEGQGPGYIWRTFTLTRLEQRDGGVYAETEMVAMSRGIPFLWRWLVHSLLEHLPQNLLVATLQDTRNAVLQEAKSASTKTHSVTRVMAHPPGKNSASGQ